MKNKGLILPYIVKYHCRISKTFVAPAFQMNYKVATKKQIKDKNFPHKIWYWNLNDESERGYWIVDTKWHYICQHTAVNDWSKYEQLQNKAAVDKYNAACDGKPVQDVNQNEDVPSEVHPFILTKLDIPIPHANETVSEGFVSIDDAINNFITAYEAEHGTRGHKKKKSKKKHRKDKKKTQKNKNKGKTKAKSLEIQSLSNTLSSNAPKKQTTIATTNMFVTENNPKLKHNNSDVNSYNKHFDPKLIDIDVTPQNIRQYSNFDTERPSPNPIILISESDDDSGIENEIDDTNILSLYFPKLKPDSIHRKIVEKTMKHCSSYWKQYWKDKLREKFEDKLDTMVIYTIKSKINEQYDSMDSNFDISNNSNNMSNNIHDNGNDNTCNSNINDNSYNTSDNTYNMNENICDLNHFSDIDNISLTDSENDDNASKPAETRKNRRKSRVDLRSDEVFDNLSDLADGLKCNKQLGKLKSRKHNELLCALSKEQNMVFTTPPSLKELSKNKDKVNIKDKCNNKSSENGKSEISNDDNDNDTGNVNDFDSDIEDDTNDNILVASEKISPQKPSINSNENIKCDTEMTNDSICEVTLSDSDSNIHSDKSSDPIDLLNQSSFSYDLNKQAQLASKINHRISTIDLDPLQTHNTLLKTPNTERRKDLKVFQQKSSKAGRKFMKKHSKINDDYSADTHMRYNNYNSDVSQEDNDLNDDMTGSDNENVSKDKSKKNVNTHKIIKQRPQRKAKTQAKAKLDGFDTKQHADDAMYAEFEAKERKEYQEKMNKVQQSKQQKMKKLQQSKQEKKRNLHNTDDNNESNNVIDEPAKKKRKISIIVEHDRTDINNNVNVGSMKPYSTGQSPLLSKASDIEKTSLESTHMNDLLALSQLSSKENSSDSNNNELKVICQWLKHVFAKKKSKPENAKCIHCQKKNAKYYKKCTKCQNLFCKGCVQSIKRRNKNSK